MRFKALHAWDLDIPQAKALQARLAEKIRSATPDGFAPKLVAGADMSHRRGSPWLYGAVVVLRFPSLEWVETATARCRARFPYVPGYLSFREGPVLLACFRKLRHKPDAVVFDAQGQAHPRRFGLASHLGLWLDLPAVGCAKSRLCGVFREPGWERGACSPLELEGARIGTVLRLRTGSKPVFVSVGHRLSLKDAEALVLACGSGRYRLPELTRIAHLAVNTYRREQESSK
ncbi:MAG: endonuclease V [Planctomycetes bacterium]|nr:endonuclease V [Planctomycetota bacterium]